MKVTGTSIAGNSGIWRKSLGTGSFVTWVMVVLVLLKVTRFEVSCHIIPVAHLCV